MTLATLLSTVWQWHGRVEHGHGNLVPLVLSGELMRHFHEHVLSSALRTLPGLL